MIALIDCDSLVYIIAYHFKEGREECIPLVENSCDSIINAILKQTNATHYFGTFGSAEKCFRYELYKYAPYKGNRLAKEDYLLFWEPIIKGYMVKQWGFIIPELNVEADDVVSVIAEYVNMGNYTVCSPDKDLRQIPGLHFNYKKMDSDIMYIDEAEADMRFYTQMLEGDSSDGVLALPGIGPVKAKQLLEPFRGDFMLLDQAVRDQYNKYYGEHCYGPMIYAENYLTLRLLCSDHPCIELYRNYIILAYRANIKPVPVIDGISDDLLRELGLLKDG